jgi:hypothetical protein
VEHATCHGGVGGIILGPSERIRQVLGKPILDAPLDSFPYGSAALLHLHRVLVWVLGSIGGICPVIILVVLLLVGVVLADHI